MDFAWTDEQLSLRAEAAAVAADAVARLGRSNDSWINGYSKEFSRELGRLGWIAAFVYCAGAALRLARFNTNSDLLDKRFFQGLPSPAAAALVAGFIWVMGDLGVAGPDVAWLAAPLTIFAGVTMVTSVKFHSFKDINLRKSVPFVVVAAFALALALISSYPPGWLFGFFLVYALSGYVLAVLPARKTGKTVKAQRLQTPPQD